MKIKNKGFTLIELIVVIVILGILVLLASPKVLGYVEKAKLARIQHNIKAAESVVNAELTKSGSLGRWGKPKKVNLDEAKNNNQLYNVKGLMSGADEIEGNEFVEIDKSDIGSKLKGDFYASQGGKVYYLNDVSVDEESEEGNDEGGTPDDVQNEDFEWVKDDEGYEVANEEGKGYYHYIGNDEVVTIPHEINGNPMTSYFRMFYDTDVKKVISDNKNVTDMRMMFHQSQATKIDFSNFDTSNVTNMSCMFDKSKATSLDLSNFKNSKVTHMAGMFRESQAKEINLSNFDTSSVIYMNEMFRGSQANKLDLSSFNTSNVIDMNWMFKESQAKKIDFSSKFDTSNVVGMNQMFRDSQVKELDLSNFVTSQKGVDMSAMFYNSQITSLDLSSFDTSKVIYMTEMFGNSNITEGYARTQEDANRFNVSSGKPSSLEFKVKHIIDGEYSFHGEVNSEDLINGTELADKIGLTAGTPQFSDEPWLKFTKKENNGNITTMFVAKKPLRYGMYWDDINATGGVFGTNVTINGNTYKVRLMKGALTDPIDTTAYDNGARGSEWNRMMLPIHEKSINKNWKYPENVEDDLESFPHTLGTGENGMYSDKDLLTDYHYSNGAATLLQEKKDDTTCSKCPIDRGYEGVSHYGYNYPKSEGVFRGWRPVLELVSTT